MEYNPDDFELYIRGETVLPKVRMEELGEVRRMTQMCRQHRIERRAVPRENPRYIPVDLNVYVGVPA